MLMKFSKIFSLMAVMHTYPRFHRDLSLSTVYALLDGIRDIVKKRDWDIEFKRVYIPKPNGGFRPLGVPTPV